MKTWIAELSRVAELVLRTGNTTEMLVLSGVAVVVCMAVLRLFAGPFGIANLTLPRLLGFLVPTIVFAFAGVIAVRLHVLPKVSGALPTLALQLACPVVVALIMPALLSALAKGPYLQCFLAFALAMVAVILVTMAVRYGWHSIVDTKAWAKTRGTSTEMSR